MVQQFLPSVAEGDKRIVLMDGAVAGAINRKPGEGEFRSNLAVGGYAEAAELTPREQEICAALGPKLKERGLIFVGIDVIGGEWLTEIHVTRSEAHTSELQSLMRISYAVFCLKQNTRAERPSTTTGTRAQT